MISYVMQNPSSGCDDLYPTNCGDRDCAPSYSCGPTVRDCYLLHLVTKGKGRFTILGKTYTVSEGEFFFIPPHTLNYYEADAQNPWSYTWVGIKGSILPSFFKKAGLSAENPVGKFTPELFELAREIYKNKTGSQAASLSSVGRTYLFLDCLERELIKPDVVQNRSTEYVELAISIIDKRLHKSVSVAALADEIGIDRSYLCSVFKKELNCSPQQYILERKVDKAKYFLSSTSENVKYIALSLGYEDQFVFSRAFKTKTGMSPSQWRAAYPANKK